MYAPSTVTHNTSFTPTTCRLEQQAPWNPNQTLYPPTQPTALYPPVHVSQPTTLTVIPGHAATTSTSNYESYTDNSTATPIQSPQRLSSRDEQIRTFMNWDLSEPKQDPKTPTKYVERNTFTNYLYEQNNAPPEKVTALKQTLIKKFDGSPLNIFPENTLSQDLSITDILTTILDKANSLTGTNLNKLHAALQGTKPLSQRLIEKQNGHTVTDALQLPECGELLDCMDSDDNLDVQDSSETDTIQRGPHPILECILPRWCVLDPQCSQNNDCSALRIPFDHFCDSAFCDTVVSTASNCGNTTVEAAKCVVQSIGCVVEALAHE